MNSRLLKRISNSKVISFDMFDTLITRNINKPYILFEFMEKELEKNDIIIPNFAQKRITADFKANNLLRNGEEKNLDQIYELFKIDNPQYDENTIAEIKKIEIKLEEAICEKNTNFFYAYEYAISLKKQVVITTDMYLPKEVIETILENNGINYDKLYLSCDYNCTKRSGKLFDFISKDFNVANGKIIHIGDNYKSDYLIPKKRGLNAFWLKAPTLQKAFRQKNKDINCIVLNNFISNHINKSWSYYFKLGYRILGPLLYSYSKWLAFNIENNSYDEVFFLSRDGFVMKRAYDVLLDEDTGKYMYASRQALISPSLWMYKDVTHILKMYYWHKSTSMNVFLRRVGLEPREYKELLKQYGYDLHEKINIFDEVKKNNFKKFWNELFPFIESNSKEEYINLIKYLDSIHFKGNVAIIDIGWEGHMQYALQSIVSRAGINAKIDGYYVGLNPEGTIQNELSMKGYLFSSKKNELLREKTRYCKALFEIAFSTSHGSVKKYSDLGIELYPYEYEGLSTSDKVKQLQDGAIQFIRDFSKYPFVKKLYLNEYASIYNFINFCNKPSLKDVNEFSTFEYLDGDLKKIIPSYSSIYFLFHPNKLISCAKSSPWVTGLFKHIFKLDINYYNVAELMRKITQF